MADRNYSLSTAAINDLKAQYAETGQFPNPHRAGAYHYTVAALVQLVPNVFHPIAKVHKAFKDIAGADWYESWANKEKRTDAGLDSPDAKFLLNLRVLQRTADFGLKLVQVGRRVLKSKGCCIDLQRDDDGGLLVRLNLDSANPLKPGRATKPEPTEIAPRARKARKISKKANETGTKAKAKRKPKATAAE